MKTNVLFIFEGENTEPGIVESLKGNLLKGHPIVTCVYRAEIYQLFERIKMDEDFDIFGLLRERSRENLSGYSRKDFSEIYLFFDYEGHSTLADDDKIEEMLSLFDNETEEGKLYISYPMVEAIRHIVDYDTFNLLTVKCKGANCPYMDNNRECDQCKKEPKYKMVVGRDGLKELQNVNSYEKWITVIEVHLSKMNYIVNGRYEFPDRIENQHTIFSNQLTKYIDKRCPEVSVLSAFPVFIHDYYGNKNTKTMCAKVTR
jgi:hypothetical protein